MPQFVYFRPKRAVASKDDPRAYVIDAGEEDAEFWAVYVTTPGPFDVQAVHIVDVPNKAEAAIVAGNIIRAFSAKPINGE